MKSNLFESKKKPSVLDGAEANLKAKQSAIGSSLSAAPTAEQLKELKAFAKVLRFTAKESWTLEEWAKAIEKGFADAELPYAVLVKEIKDARDAG